MMRKEKVTLAVICGSIVFLTGGYQALVYTLKDDSNSKNAEASRAWIISPMLGILLYSAILSAQHPDIGKRTAYFTCHCIIFMIMFSITLGDFKQ